MTRTGELRQRITYKQKSVTKNKYGEEVISWVDFVAVWAKIEDVRGTEYFANNSRQYQSEVTHVVTQRYYPNIDVKMEINFGTRTFEILYFADIEERRRHQKIMVKERQ